jgi:hypothetical protein
MKLIEMIKSLLKALATTVTESLNRKKRRREYKRMLELNSNKDRFSTIYDKKLWKSNESESGEGSEFSYTEKLRHELPALISDYNINVIVDAPCGDFNWMRFVLPKVDNVDYFGFDIVESVISSNNENYSTDKIHFEVADICKDHLPSCDLLIVRDCLFHLSYQDVERFLQNIQKVDYKYLLTSTHVVGEETKNSDIETGDFRLIDLFKIPFSFDSKHILQVIDDYPEGHATKKRVILIKKENVPSSLTLNSN